MGTDNNKKDYGDYFDDFFDNNNIPNEINRRKKVNNNKKRKRKGLKWKLIDFKNSKYFYITIIIAVALSAVLIFSSISSCNKSNDTFVTEHPTTVAPTTQAKSYQILGVPVLEQGGGITAACETYACTMLLQYYDFDIDVYEFVDNYLVTKPVYFGEDGTRYGPDMNSAYAGDVYTGYGINAPGMAKCMNNYLKNQKTALTAQPLTGLSLENLCEDYILNDIPVMVWATTYMDEPYVKTTWIVDYADNDSDVKVGDTVSWQIHEHCMVLIGFDEDNYYFSDSVSGKVSAYDKATSEERYSQIGMQAIILK